MSTTATLDLAEHVIAALRAYETELRQTGIPRLSVFGSVARGEAEAESDVDLAAELDPGSPHWVFRAWSLGAALGRAGRPQGGPAASADRALVS